MRANLYLPVIPRGRGMRMSSRPPRRWFRRGFYASVGDLRSIRCPLIRRTPL